ncbi:MAG: nucleotidyltransferase domain-containing protein, partial [Campylobacterota bacterium]|nr:nucleotidyltransferase domain-containing protein [Campylobacterota bacterium]
MKKENLIIEENVIKILKDMKEVKFAYLFGSYVSNLNTKTSDIDIAIFINDGYNLFDTHLMVHHKIEIALKKEIDIVVLNSAKNFILIQDILNNGRLLKDSIDDSREMYEIY